MIRNVLSHIGGVGLYGVISVVLFFVTFVVAVSWAMLQRRSLMIELAALPLAEDAPTQNLSGEHQHESDK